MKFDVQNYMATKMKKKKKTHKLKDNNKKNVITMVGRVCKLLGSSVRHF